MHYRSSLESPRGAPPSATALRHHPPVPPTTPHHTTHTHTHTHTPRVATVAPHLRQERSHRAPLLWFVLALPAHTTRWLTLPPLSSSSSSSSSSSPPPPPFVAGNFPLKTSNRCFINFTPIPREIHGGCRSLRVPHRVESSRLRWSTHPLRQFASPPKDIVGVRARSLKGG